MCEWRRRKKLDPFLWPCGHFHEKRMRLMTHVSEFCVSAGNCCKLNCLHSVSNGGWLMRQCKSHNFAINHPTVSPKTTNYARCVGSRETKLNSTRNVSFQSLWTLNSFDWDRLRVRGNVKNLFLVFLKNRGVRRCLLGGEVAAVGMKEWKIDLSPRVFTCHTEMSKLLSS